MVEWGRSAYQSTWHLFRDSPETRTVGRYYRARPGTPHVQGKHNLGSRNWHDKNWKHIVTLGEDLEAVSSWDAGLPPALLPFNRQVGESTCLEIGDKLAEALRTNQIDNGFNEHCFLVCGERDEMLQVATGFNTCSIQKFYALLIAAMYEDDGATVGTMLYQLLGPEAVVKFHEAVGLMPAVTTVCTDKITIIVMDGTRTFQQIALQGLTSLTRPTNQGPFGTVPIWWAASQWAHNIAMADGQIAGTPVFLVGHSYGGAAALVLAARYRVASADRLIRFLTYGCPKPGDQRLRTLLETCEGINLCNDNDLITVFPPDAETLTPVIAALGAPQLGVWVNYKRPPNQVKQFDNGQLDPNDLDVTDFSTMLNIATRVLLDEDIAFISGHVIAEYLRRITLRCPGISWPNLEPCIPVVAPDEEALTLTREVIAISPDALVLASPAGANVDAIALTKVPSVPGALVLAATGLDLPSGFGLDVGVEDDGSFGLWGPGPTNCPCCGDWDSPLDFTVRLTAPGYGFDGQLIPMHFIIDEHDGCTWLGDEENLFVVTEVVVRSSPSYPGTLKANFSALGIGFPTLWTIGAGVHPVDSFSCLPWGFTMTAEILENFVPTGDFVTITVESIP